MDALAETVKAGKVRRVGVSNYGADQMQRAHERLASHGVRLASNQVEYSLLQRATGDKRSARSEPGSRRDTHRLQPHR